MMHRPLLLALASAIALGFAAAAPASAAPRADHLNYAALDLDDRAGAEALLRRIEQSAEDMCGDRMGPMPLAQRTAIRQCVRQKSERAVADVGHAGVTALFYDRNPQIIVASR
jgi:UrcA family protein